MEELCAYIDRDRPVLIWATMGMKESFRGDRWYLENGEEFTWISREHCLVLVGYDDTRYYLNDPMTGNTEIYVKALVERRYAELGRQAVLIRQAEPV